jgi:ribosomal protein L12E/L44/L45/RPP1/RPP2
VHQVAAVEDRDAGEVLEAGTDEVVVVAHAADARIRVEAGDHGVEHGVFPMF